ncbi:HigA family addiction module antitoxin [Sphingomonas sp. BIUV-7]|uniref:HigA family addiction module antitoxin n=1 Tax=Sphingomonas natans TaxID=3063330 RepID=A0ABT8YEQ4_9SPHN|nr:HigA family addiction module antitoxin [Sphingomonas sp. BIUV-7]MDO6416842.1 HigA family addiction module antitoxin [Sphingomonas sp. BIUV-7]
MERAPMSKSPTITEGSWSSDPADWLPNPSASEILRIEFLEPIGMAADELGRHIDLPAARLTDVLEGHKPMDAELDLRLARYFRMSEGFFLGLQDRYELLEAKRALNGALDRIVPRAA